MFNLPAAILFVSGITGVVMTIILRVIQQSYPRYIKGITEWSNATLLATISMFLFLGRGQFPDFFSIVVANVLLLWAFIQINSACRLLTDKKPWLIGRRLSAILIAISGVELWFTYIDPSISSRTLAFTAFLLPVALEQLFFIIKQLEKSPGRSVMIMTLAVVIFGRGLRAIMVLGGQELPSDIFENTFINIFSVAIPALTLPLSTVSCIMLASEKLHRRLEYTSQHDDLTDLLNKKTITTILQQEIRRSKRLNNELSVMLLDLDDFKAINDQHGHLTGDKVLVDFAKKAKSSFRETDHLARFGGDEFMAVLPDTSAKQAKIIANRINRAGKSSSPAWSTSIGIAQFIEADTFETVLTRADKALYQSKKSGKSRVFTTKNYL